MFRFSLVKITLFQVNDPITGLVVLCTALAIVIVVTVIVIRARKGSPR